MNRQQEVTLTLPAAVGAQLLTSAAAEAAGVARRSRPAVAAPYREAAAALQRAARELEA